MRIESSIGSGFSLPMAVLPGPYPSLTGGASMPKKREPGDLGRISKGVPVEWTHLKAFSDLRREGAMVLEWPDFVNEAIGHELARYKETKKRRN